MSKKVEKVVKKVKLGKVNELHVEPIPGVNRLKSDKSIFGTNNPSFYIVGIPKSGKSVVIFNLLKWMADENTIVIIFANQLKKDDSYIEIMKMLKSKNIMYIPENSFYDKDGEDQLMGIMEHLKNNTTDKYRGLDPFAEDSEDETEEELTISNIMAKAEADKRQEIGIELPPLKYIIVIDDMAGEMREYETIGKLLKQNDHLKCSVILATQGKNDLKPSTISQFTHAVLFPGISGKGIVDLHKDLGIPMDISDFLGYYQHATEGKNQNGGKNFLFIDKPNNSLFKNFNKKYDNNSIQND